MVTLSITRRALFVLLSASLVFAEDPRLSDPARLQQLQDELITLELTDLVDELARWKQLPEPAADRLIELKKTEAADALAKRDAAELKATLDALFALYDRWLAGNPRNLAQAIVYRSEYAGYLDQAIEAPFNAIAFRGGSPADDAELERLAQKRVALIIESLAVIDRLRNTPNATIEQLQRADEYEFSFRWQLAFARYQLALALANNPAEQRRMAALAGQVIEFLTTPAVEGNADSVLTEAPNAASTVRYPANLLAGRAFALLGDGTRARQHLQRVIDERDDSVANFVGLKFQARFELLRATLDAAKTPAEFEQADRLAADVAAWYDQQPELAHLPALKVATLLVRAEIATAKARTLQATDPTRAAAARNAAFKPLADLANRQPELLGVINRQLYEIVKAAPDPQKLDSFPLQALATMTFFNAFEAEAAGRRDEATALYEASVPLNDILLARTDDLATSVRPIALFNLAAARRNLGELRNDAGMLVSAGHTFIQMAEEFPKHPDAIRAVESAAAVLDPLRRRGDAPQAAEATFLAAVRTMNQLNPTHPLAKAGRLELLFDAATQALELPEQTDPEVLAKLEALRAAASGLRQVPEADPRFSFALLQRTRLGLADWQLYTERIGNLEESQARARELTTVALETARELAARAERIQDPDRRATTLQDAGQVLLLAAAVQADRRVNQPAEVLQILRGFDERFSAFPDLVGEALARQIQALGAQRETERAATMVDQYVRLNPDRAGPVIAGVLLQMIEDIDSARQAGDAQAVRLQATAAKNLADEMVRWAEANTTKLADGDLYRYRRTQAQVYLDAELYDEARAIFEDLRREGQTRSAQAQAEIERIEEQRRGARLRNAFEQSEALTRQLQDLRTRASADGQVLFGLADLAYRQQRWSAAAAEFADIASRMPRSDSAYFKTLLRLADSRLRAAEAEPDPEMATRERSLAAELISDTLHVERGNMGGLRAEFERLAEQLGVRAPVITTAPALATAEPRPARPAVDPARDADAVRTLAIAAAIGAPLVLVGGFMFVLRRYRQRQAARLAAYRTSLGPS